jgi:hypothetical protein
LFVLLQESTAKLLLEGLFAVGKQILKYSGLSVTSTTTHFMSLCLTFLLLKKALPFHRNGNFVFMYINL